MDKIMRLALLTMCCLVASPSSAAAPKKIGILVFDGFLTSDVTAPVEVFGAAIKKCATANGAAAKRANYSNC